MSKISLESWFLKTGLNIGFASLVRDTAADPKAQGGLIFWLEGVFGPRYYFATDNIRPFFEIGVRLAGAIPTTQATEVLPLNFKVFPGVYAQLGLEFIVSRDIGLTFLANYCLYPIINFRLMP